MFFLNTSKNKDGVTIKRKVKIMKTNPPPQKKPKKFVHLIDICKYYTLFKIAVNNFHLLVRSKEIKTAQSVTQELQIDASSRLLK